MEKPTVVDRIFSAIAASGMSLRTVARRAAISEGTIQKWKRGDSFPSLATRRALAKVLAVPLAEFVAEGSDTEEQSQTAISDYLASPLGADLTPHQVDQLRLCPSWIQSPEPLTTSDVHDAAQIIRRRVPKAKVGRPKGS